MLTYGGALYSAGTQRIGDPMCIVAPCDRPDSQDNTILRDCDICHVRARHDVIIMALQ